MVIRICDLFIIFYFFENLVDLMKDINLALIGISLSLIALLWGFTEFIARIHAISDYEYDMLINNAYGNAKKLLFSAGLSTFNLFLYLVKFYLCIVIRGVLFSILALFLVILTVISIALIFNVSYTILSSIKYLSKFKE